MLFFVIWSLGIAAAAIHAFLRRRSLDRAGVLRIFLLYQLVLGWGLSGVLGFAGHALRPEQVARGIGWPAHPQFQFELAAFELGYGLAAFLGLWLRDRRYWLGFSVAPGIFLILAAVQHAREAIVRGNFEPYNFLIIAPDLLIPLAFFGLLVALFRAERGAP